MWIFTVFVALGFAFMLYAGVSFVRESKRPTKAQHHLSIVEAHRISGRLLVMPPKVQGPRAAQIRRGAGRGK